MNENRQALLFVERDATEVLRVNGKRHVVWNDRAPSACTHYCYQHVARPDGVPLQFSILRMGNESEFVPAKWWHHLLHNQSSLMLKGALLFKPNVIVISVPYHLGLDKRSGNGKSGAANGKKLGR